MAEIKRVLEVGPKDIYGTSNPLTQEISSLGALFDRDERVCVVECRYVGPLPLGSGAAGRRRLLAALASRRLWKIVAAARPRGPPNTRRRRSSAALLLPSWAR